MLQLNRIKKAFASIAIPENQVTCTSRKFEGVDRVSVEIEVQIKLSTAILYFLFRDLQRAAPIHGLTFSKSTTIFIQSTIEDLQLNITKTSFLDIFNTLPFSVSGNYSRINQLLINNKSILYTINKGNWNELKTSEVISSNSFQYESRSFLISHLNKILENAETLKNMITIFDQVSSTISKFKSQEKK